MEEVPGSVWALFRYYGVKASSLWLSFSVFSWQTSQFSCGNACVYGKGFDVVNHNATAADNGPLADMDGRLQELSA
ncbi:MAG: hypothetical protein KAI82_05945, partial [Tritonibacter mobilis]|nr:hypothetical protein [Tritonibacter mobilis]